MATTMATTGASNNGGGAHVAHAKTDAKDEATRGTKRPAGLEDWGHVGKILKKPRVVFDGEPEGFLPWCDAVHAVIQGFVPGSGLLDEWLKAFDSRGWGSQTMSRALTDRDAARDLYRRLSRAELAGRPFDPVQEAMFMSLGRLVRREYDAGGVLLFLAEPTERWAMEMNMETIEAHATGTQICALLRRARELSAAIALPLSQRLTKDLLRNFGPTGGMGNLARLPDELSLLHRKTQRAAVLKAIAAEGVRLAATDDDHKMEHFLRVVARLVGADQRRALRVLNDNGLFAALSVAARRRLLDLVDQTVKIAGVDPADAIAFPAMADALEERRGEQAALALEFAVATLA